MSAFVEILAFCVLVFLFWGDPDPYDRLHDYVMSLDQKVEQPKPQERHEVNAFTLRRQ